MHIDHVYHFIWDHFSRLPLYTYISVNGPQRLSIPIQGNLWAKHVTKHAEKWNYTRNILKKLIENSCYLSLSRDCLSITHRRRGAPKRIVSLGELALKCATRHCTFARTKQRWELKNWITKKMCIIIGLRAKAEFREKKIIFVLIMFYNLVHMSYSNFLSAFIF